MQVSVLEWWFLCMFSFLERKFLILLVYPSFQSMSDYLSVRKELEMNFCGLFEDVLEWQRKCLQKTIKNFELIIKNADI